MNKTLFVGGLAALTLAAAGGVAVAQQATGDQPARHARADADGDGRISQAEFVDRRIQRLTAADADHDGSVTREEMRATMQARRAERVAARFDRMDADKDGALTRAEFDAPRAAGAMAVRHHGMRGHGPRRMAAHRMARPTHGPIVIAEVQARTEQAFTRLDGDHDGYVTTTERQAVRRQMRERRVERRAERRAQRQASPSAPASE